MIQSGIVPDYILLSASYTLFLGMFVHFVDLNSIQL